MNILFIYLKLCIYLAGGQYVEMVTLSDPPVGPWVWQKMSEADSRNISDHWPIEQYRSHTWTLSQERKHWLSSLMTVFPSAFTSGSVSHWNTFPFSSWTVPVRTRSLQPQPGVGLAEAFSIIVPVVSWIPAGKAELQTDNSPSATHVEETTISALWRRPSVDDSKLGHL